MEFQSSTDFRLESFLITPHIGETIDAKNLLVAMEYCESITSPFLVATAQIVDSVGLINTLPIKGGEMVELRVLTSASEEVYSYKLKIWQVGNRFAEQKKQTYTLGLISPEAITNETSQVTVGTTGNPYSIIGNSLKTDLKTDKEFFGENSLFEVQMLPGVKKPFEFYTSLSIKSVSPHATYQSSGSGNTNETMEEIKGSGGFFFWETRRGYNFFAVDSLLADEKSKFKSKKLKSPSWGSEPDEPYTESPGNTGQGGDDRFTIKRSVFGSEINLMESLRKGKLASKVVFFNHSTGQYSEYMYRLSNNYDNMSHLGGQKILTKVPSGMGDELLENISSRNLSILLDHETWFNEPGVASPEPEDGAEKPTKFADWQKYFSVQSISRYQLLQNQVCTIVIPGNSEICAGDKINIRLISKLPDELAKDEPYDLESSGEYLIGEVTHQYDPTMGNNGRFLTTLRLMRDSYGMKDKVSAHST
jgi:hypothetical protein